MSDLQALIGQHFAYAHGRMGVLKQLLLDKSDVDRLLGSHSLREVEKILTELKMTNVIDQGISEGRAILEAVGSWMRGEVEQMSPISHRPIFHILWLEGDAPLLAYFLKKHHGLNLDLGREPVSHFNAYDPDALRALVLDDVAGLLPSRLVEFVREIRAKEGQTAQEIDNAVAQYIAQTQSALARTSGSKDIRQFLAHRIDLQNIRTTLRLIRDGIDDRTSFLLEGGTISTNEFAGSIQDLIKTIERSSLAFYLPSNLEEVLGDTIEFERNAAYLIASDISKMWNVPLSIEPLFAFAAITIAQLQLIRTILITKANELSPQQIKRVLPPFLSASSFLT